MIPYELMIPPAFVMIIGALLLPVLPKFFRSIWFLIVSLLTLVILWNLPVGSFHNIPFLRHNLVLTQSDALSRVFGAIFALIAFIGGIYSFHVKDVKHQIAALLYGGSALGITFAGDLITLFIYWELMAISSSYLIWARKTKESEKAGMRYLIVHLFGGSLLLAGILLHIDQTNSILITQIPQNYSLASWLILIGVCLNAAVPPLHAWLSDAYPKATVTGAVFLSAFTTKAAVYVLVRMFAGWEVLLWFGVAMALYGVVFAVLANDIREILAYHIISQVGYMVAGVGIGTIMSLNGTTAHAFSHILYKALLFMGAGVVLQTTGKSKLTELGGLYKNQQLTFWLYMIGAFSISGFPLFNGFISKSIIVGAAGESQLDWAFLLLTLASIGTFYCLGLKIPKFTWFDGEKNVKSTKLPLNMHIGMAFAAGLCFIFGVAPSLLYRYLPFPLQYEPYTASHLVETVQLLIFTFVGFWLLKRIAGGEQRITLDTDWIYRRLAKPIWNIIVIPVDKFFSHTDVIMMGVVKLLVWTTKNPMQLFNPSLKNISYNPDRQRTTTQVIISLILLCMVFLGIVGLWYLK
ncbi:MAG: Na(+)/H(+) antiporter subunit D [Bacteroidota bacterium]|nr:Na(+)/H(+) antiporter subunit D [Bacteroidota bacterium]